MFGPGQIRVPIRQMPETPLFGPLSLQVIALKQPKSQIQCSPDIAVIGNTRIYGEIVDEFVMASLLSNM